MVTAAGELDVAAAPVLRLALADAMSRRDPVTVDMSGVTFLDACALRVLVEAAMSARGDGRGIVLLDPSPMTVRLLQITGVLKVFGVARHIPEKQPVSPSPAGCSPSPTSRSRRRWRSRASLPAPLPGL